MALRYCERAGVIHLRSSELVPRPPGAECPGATGLGSLAAGTGIDTNNKGRGIPWIYWAA